MTGNQRTSRTDEEAVSIEVRYQRALQWIRTISGMHYFGGAFDPEHMRDIANIAGNALDLRWSPEGGRLRVDLPDYEAAMEKSMEYAREMAAKWGSDLAGDDEGEDDAADR